MKKKFTLRKFRILLFVTLIFVQFNSQAQSWQWAKRVGSFNDNAPFSTGDQNERFNDIKVDAIGNVYAVGEFFQNSAFDNQTTGFPTTGGYGDRDAYLVKFDKCGKTLWWRRMGGTGHDWAVSLVLDGSNKVIISGYCAPTFSLSGNGISDTAISSGGSLTSFIARFDTSGNFIDRFNGAGFGGNLFITNQGDYFSVAQGFLGVKINSLGATVGTYTYVAQNSYPWINIKGVTLDKSDNVYCTGFITSTVIVGGATVTYTNGPTNSIIYKFSSGGTLLWVKSSIPSNGGGDLLEKCTVDTSGAVLATAGRAKAGITVFGYSVNVPPSAPGFGGCANVFYYFDSNTGNLLSATTATIQWQDIISPYHTDKNNNIHCAGTMNGYLQFSTGTYSTNPVTTTRQNVIAKMDLAGNLLAASVVPQSGSNNSSVNEGIFGLDTDTLGNVYIAGMFGGTLDSMGTQVNIIGGSEDGFIAKYGYPCTTAPTASVPNTPLALAAVNASLTNNVTWQDNSNNEDNFDLHYTISPSTTYSLLATLPMNTTSYAHTGLSHTTTYCYKVAATNTVGLSAFSNTDCATTPADPSGTITALGGNTAPITHAICFPNPAGTEVHFEVPGKGQADVEICNALGSVVLMEKNYVSRDKINIAGLSKGLYYFKIKSGGTEYVGKVIKE